jgi:hypothetical protein
VNWNNNQLINDNSNRNNPVNIDMYNSIFDLYMFHYLNMDLINIHWIYFHNLNLNNLQDKYIDNHLKQVDINHYLNKDYSNNNWSIPNMLFPKIFIKKIWFSIIYLNLHYILVDNHIYNYWLMFDIFHHLNKD